MLDLPAAGATTSSRRRSLRGVWRRSPLPAPITACQTGHTVCDAAIAPG